MQFLNGHDLRDKITEYARKGDAFLFAIDFSATQGFVFSPGEAVKQNIFFDIRGITNRDESLNTAAPSFAFSFTPVSSDTYRKAFEKVMYHLHRGDTYLLNLTFPTRISCDLSLNQVFYCSKAPYRLVAGDKFVVFSPESFIRINGNRIYSFPMKGTIDAGIPDAEKKILADPKEMFEHNTIVDLIRNDLAMVSAQVTVNRFRYVEKIRTNRKALLQVSSEICGILDPGWKSHLGDLLFRLLPAGSISGAPKERTMQIIRETENYDRGFYTGIFGFFDGRNLDSAVMIRFIENTEEGMFYKSGGGITSHSDMKSEYEELLQKVYVPVF